MDVRQIEQLLERYFECATTLEEEAQLRRFFCEEDVPLELLPNRDLFAYQQEQAEARLSEDFDARLLAKIDVPVVKAKKVTLVTRLMPMFRAAAMIVGVLLIGSLLEHSFNADVQEIAQGDTISGQISVPSVAQSDDADQQVIDSLDISKALKNNETDKD